MKITDALRRLFRRRLTINWVVPEPSPGAGGDTGLFRIARYLAEFGHLCRVYVVSWGRLEGYSTEQIRAYMRQHFGATRAEYFMWNETVADADATVATFWPTAELVAKLPNGGRRFYMVQDYEPSFYPGDEFHTNRAENTYRLGFHCITLGPWLAQLLREQFRATASYFDFAVEREIYRPRPAARAGKQRVCFYARPATPRRAYALGVEALRLVKEEQPKVEIVLFGAEDLTPVPPFEFVQRGLLKPEELAQLFSSSTVGLVLSLSNPSFVPLEMMACRCAVVEIASERWEGVLTHGENAWLAEPNAPALAEAMLRLLRDSELREKIAENGLRHAQTLHWRDSARQVEAVLLRFCSGAATP
ncbi:N/A [soil metagenome]